MARVSATARVSEKARAKINLTLRILGRRADGYHELESLVAFAAVGDLITLDTSGDLLARRALRMFARRRPADPMRVDAPSNELTVSGPFAARIEGANLVDRAIELLWRSHPDMFFGRVTLDKQLPVAAGLGGGSADAAAVLRAMRTLNPGHAGTVDWLGIACQLGADVPVCLLDRPAVMRGIGERTTPFDVPAFAAVLVNPQTPVAADKTRRVFQTLAASPVSASGKGSRLEAGVADLAQLIGLMRRHGNDLERPALAVMPTIADVMAVLLGCPGCLHAQLSGAGPTCFGLFANEQDADSAALSVSAKHPSWWVRATTIGG